MTRYTFFATCSLSFILAFCGSTVWGQTNCPADITGPFGTPPDGEVNVHDLLQVLNNSGPCADPNNCPEDLNGDGIVGEVDVAYLIESWGPCPHDLPGAIEWFDELIAVDVTTPDAESFGLVVTHLYATGDNVSLGDPLLIAHDASITADSGDFFLAPSGGNTPPDSFDISVDPILAYDTFVTMRELTDYAPEASNVNISSSVIEGSWFHPADVTSTVREAVDISSTTGNPDQYGVRIAQITMEDCLPVAYSGTVRLYTSSHIGGSLQGVTATVQFSKSPAPSTCPADLTGPNGVPDGIVDVSDLLELLAQWGPCIDPCNCPADLTGDRTVGVIDLVYMHESAGPCPHDLPGQLELFDDVIAVNATPAEAKQFGLIVTHLYATGDNVTSGDALMLVRDADIIPLDGPGFFKPFFFPFKSTPPDSSDISIEPTLAYDTFVTMDALSDYTPRTMSLDVLMNGISGSWYEADEGMSAPPGPQREAVDISHLTRVTGQYGVRIAQITMEFNDFVRYGGSARLYTSTHDEGALEGVNVTFEFSACPGDITGSMEEPPDSGNFPPDGIVDVFDLLKVIGAWGDCDDPDDCPADLNGDEVVDVFDLLAVIGNWGVCNP